MKFQALFDQTSLAGQTGMESALPNTPGRGRSRFSKALPIPPREVITTAKSPQSSSTSTSLNSPLPPIPKDTPPIPKDKMSTTVIVRRPVGGEQTEHPKTVEVTSVPSVSPDASELSPSFSSSSGRAKDSLGGIHSENGATPPLPPKDSQRQLLPKRANNTLATLDPTLPASPPRPEIWRRRSEKIDRNITLQGLKLNKSNGSTASIQQQPAPDRDLPAVPYQLPRSAAGRKPLPRSAAQEQPDLMGSKLSKLTGEKKRSSDSSSSDGPQNQQYSSLNRLPTPEYLKTDKQPPLTPQVLAAASPHTPPNDILPQVPQKSESRSTPAADSVLPNTTNGSYLLSSHSRETSETLTITSAPVVMRSPQPKKAYAAKILTSDPSPSPNANSTPVLSPPPGLAINFPKVSSAVATGTIFHGPELGIVQFDCYQSHKFMRSSKNTHCPVACMVCRKNDMSMLWRCSWCCLSACAACMKELVSIPGNNLRICLENVGMGTEYNR